MIALRHVRRDRDRHGNIRIYLRVPGHRQVRLREPVGSAAFLAEYQAALAVAEGTPAPQARGRRARLWRGCGGAPTRHRPSIGRSPRGPAVCAR